ncbi:HEPN domain-containing protein [Pyrococcus kukulkanii]|uniref:HEPN domain-containing protein n=1 Tax=Pyrococcus kukulkanii TaxID=1609559 RepID=A0ABV4T4F6_9EURY
MRRDPREEAMRWLRQAERDLEDAKFVFNGKRYNLACFLAQQAAEKALKAYLYHMGEEFVFGHSVSDLCKRAMEYDKEFREICKAGVLDKYYIPTRYPNGLPGGVPYEAFDEYDAERAISLAEMAINFVKNKLVVKNEG